MIVKKLTLTLTAMGAISVCSAAFADQMTGFYVGGQIGYGNASYDSKWSTSKDEGGFAGRPYVGYQFNQNFGIETGYTFFSDNTYHFDNWSMTPTKTISTDQWDILFKAGMPFNNGFRGDVKVGVADVMPTTHWNNDSWSWSNSLLHRHHDDNNWDPAAGVGVSYSLTQNFALDVSYLHAFGSNDDCDPDTDLVTFGVSYYFN